MKEYARLCSAVAPRVIGIGEVTPEEGGYVSLGPCPALTENGCIFPYEERPVLCRYYPFVPVRTKQGNITLLLVIKTCPYWKEIGDMHDQELEEIMKKEAENQ